jgi:hypothetical protein
LQMPSIMRDEGFVGNGNPNIEKQSEKQKIK